VLPFKIGPINTVSLGLTGFRVTLSARVSHPILMVNAVLRARLRAMRLVVAITKLGSGCHPWVTGRATSEAPPAMPREIEAQPSRL
jgi:hypothetical protein